MTENVPLNKKITHNISTNNEWDTLQTVCVGNIENAGIPKDIDISLLSIDYPYLSKEELKNQKFGRYPKKIIEETQEDLSDFVDMLEKIGVTVVRPKILDPNKKNKNIYWSVSNYYNYCPRDILLTIGKKVIATPVPLRHRQNEYKYYNSIFNENSWIIAPKPKLKDDIYSLYKSKGISLLNKEAVFDAANIIKCNENIIYLESNTGNREGAIWLQEILGIDYKVHVMSDVYIDKHIDTTILPLREGLFLCNPDRISKEDIPKAFKNWDIIWSPEMEEIPFYPELRPASKWIGMNILSLSPDLVVVEKNQVSLIKAIEKKGINCMPISLRHSRTLGGGPHCITLDISRKY